MGVASVETGTWRKGEFVQWTDVVQPVQAMLVYLGLLVLALAVVALIAAENGGATSDLRTSFESFVRQPIGVQTLTGAFDLVLLFYVWRVARRVGNGALVARFRSVRSLVAILTALGGIAGAVAVYLGLVQLYRHGLIRPDSHAQDQFMERGPLYQIPVLLVVVAFIAPFVEEFYFRGILLSWLHRKMHAVPAVLVSSTIFGLLHFKYLYGHGLEAWILTGVITLLGIVNATLAFRTRSLWPPIVFHAAYNGTLVAAAAYSLLAAHR